MVSKKTDQNNRKKPGREVIALRNIKTLKLIKREREGEREDGRKNILGRKRKNQINVISSRLNFISVKIFNTKRKAYCI